MKSALLIAVMLCAACAHVDQEKKGAICEEYRNIVCVSGTVCDYDSQKGCQVCRCECINGRCDDANMLTNPDLPRNVEPVR
jgi:hypothetical protein